MAELLKLIEAGQNPDAFDHIVVFSVTKSWKSQNSKTVKAKLLLGMFKDALSLQLGQSYLIIGRDFEDGNYRIRNRCSDVIQGNLINELVSVLDEQAVER